MQRKIQELEKEIAELKDRFERERTGLSQGAQELRDQYEKKISELKKAHADELQRLKDEYERRLRELERAKD